MIIRDYQRQDFNELQQLWQNLGMGGLERGDTPEIIEQCNRMGGRLLILEDPVTGDIAGSSWLTFDGRRVFLHHFGVKRSYQGKGYGNLLADVSLGFVKEKGYQVKLEVHEENRAARALYEKFGFSSLSGYDVYIIRKVNEIGRGTG